MSEPELVDTRFAMPALDQPPLTEIGVILSGLDIERLLAGLGAAGDVSDPTQVVLLVDRLRHGSGDGMAAALSAGARRWLAMRPVLAAVDRVPSVSASIRQARTISTSVGDQQFSSARGVAARHLGIPVQPE